MNESIDYFDYLTADAPSRRLGDLRSIALRIRCEIFDSGYFGKQDNPIRTLMFFEIVLMTGCPIDDLCQ